MANKDWRFCKEYGLTRIISIQELQAEKYVSGKNNMFLRQEDRKEMLEYLKNVKQWREECQTVLTMLKNITEIDIWNFGR